MIKEEVLLICDMGREQDRKMAESLEKPHIELTISNKTGGDYARFGNQPTLFRKLSSLQGKELIKFIER